MFIRLAGIGSYWLTEGIPLERKAVGVKRVVVKENVGGNKKARVIAGLT